VSVSMPAANVAAAAKQLASLGYCALAPEQASMISAQYFSTGVIMAPLELELELEVDELLLLLLLVVSPVMSSLQPTAKSPDDANNKPRKRMLVFFIASIFHFYARNVKAKVVFAQVMCARR
jgi:hypothetical protein